MIAYNQLPDNARVWIYQSNRAFSDAQTKVIERKIVDFIQEWRSHGAAVRAWGGIKYNRFIILIVDESYEVPSGCSIDSSVALIKQIGTKMNVNMFDRLDFAYKTADNKVLSAGRDDFADLYANNQINDQTIVFNNLVTTKKDLENKWEIALADSWHINMI